MARPFRELKEKHLAEHPESAPRIQAYKRAADAAVRLAEVRSERGVTQTRLSESLGVSQRRVSSIEHQDDLYLSTVRDYVEALGGELELIASFPDGDVRLEIE